MKNQIKIGTLIGYINIFVQILATLIFVPTTIKLIGQSEYGLYSLVVSFMAYFSVLDMGFGNAMIRFTARAKAKKSVNQEQSINGLFLFLYSIIGVIAIILGIIAIMNINLIFNSGLTLMELKKIRILMFISIVSISFSFPLSVFDSYIMANERFIILKGLNLLKNVLTPITILVFLYNGYDSIAMLLITNIYIVIVHIINMIYCLKKLQMKFKFSIKKIDKKLLREVFYYSFFVFLNIVIDNLYNNTDKVILGSVSGTLAVAIYAVATNFTSMNMSFSTSISSLFLPQITKIIETSDYTKKISNLFIKISRIQLYIMLFILSSFILFGRQFLLLWVGKKYLDAYFIVIMLIGPAIIPLTQNIGISILQAMNRHAFRSIVYFVIAIINIMISIPLAKSYGCIGTAVGTALATFLGQIIIMNIFYWKEIGIDIPKYWSRFIKFSGPIFIVTILVSFLISNISFNIFELFIWAMFYSIIYFLYSYANTNDYERNLINSLKKKMLEMIKK